MRGSRLTAVSAGLMFAVAVPAWAHSEAARGCPRAEKTPKSAPAASRKGSDTLVVPDGGPGRPGYTMVGENVTYADPTFVPYKLRDLARRARENTDISKIP